LRFEQAFNGQLLDFAWHRSGRSLAGPLLQGQTLGCHRFQHVAIGIGERPVGARAGSIAFFLLDRQNMPPRAGNATADKTAD